MSTPERKFGYAFGTFATIMVLILDFLVILSSVSNCIVYNKIVSGEPNSDISVEWGRFLLVINVIVAIFAFIIFFWILYILFTGKKSIGDELQKKRDAGGIGNYLYDTSKEIKSSIQSRYMSQGASPSQAAAAATSLINAARAGDPAAAAVVAASVPTTLNRPVRNVSDLKRWVESQSDGAEGWDAVVDLNSFNIADRTSCFDDNTQIGCSKNLSCNDGSIKLPCGSSDGNDSVINNLFLSYSSP
jgi:hypothetical protein